MRMQGNLLSTEEKERIHHDSLRILEEIGIRFPSQRALSLLELSGARIDWDKQVAYISQDMVKSALEAAPREFVMGARNQDHNLKLPSAASVFNLDGCGVNTLDFNTGERRDGMLQDVADSARVLKNLTFVISFGHPSRPAMCPMMQEVLLVRYCFHKYLQAYDGRGKTKGRNPVSHRNAKSNSCSEASVIERKIYSVTYCTVAPLCHDEDMLEATMDLSRYHAPILVYPMPACGTTGPAGLYSNIALANAEALSCIVIFQLASPSVPILFGSALGVVNVRSGMFLEGAPETMLEMMAMSEMGKYYGLPTMMAGCLSDAKSVGMQSVIEKVLTTLPLVLAEVDVVQGIGLIESSMTLSLEQMIIDHEIAQLCKRIKEGVDVSDEKDYFADIKAVGHGGHFLKQKSTRAAFRSKEFYQSGLCDRNSYDGWVDLGRPEMIDLSREKVNKILTGEKKNPLPQQTEKVIKEIIEEAKAKLNEE